MTTGNREDYLINILRLTEKKPVAKTTELAALMKVSAASVSEMLNTLSEEKMVSYQKYRGVSLTAKGKEHAEHLRKKHHIMEDFLINVLETDATVAHEEACKMEHVISDESASKMCQMMGPKEACDTCNDTCTVKNKKDMITLTSMDCTLSGTISHLKCDNPAQMRKLISMGFVPGKVVKKDRSSQNGPCIVRIGDTNVALDSSLMDVIFVDTA